MSLPIFLTVWCFLIVAISWSWSHSLSLLSSLLTFSLPSPSIPLLALTSPSPPLGTKKKTTCTMPPRSSLTSSFSVTDANNEVVCPLKNNDGSNCRKRCLGVSIPILRLPYLSIFIPQLYPAQLAPPHSIPGAAPPSWTLPCARGFSNIHCYTAHILDISLVYCDRNRTI